MPPHLTGEAPPGRRARLGAWLRTRTLVQWVLAAMFAVGVLAFVRAFAGGEGVAAQRLAWGSLAWTFPLLWDLTAVIGSTLWIAAPRRTAAFRWGVFLNLTATIVSGLATGSQAYTLARDQVPQGWPVPAFVAGAAVPLLYSILTWAASSARDALADRSIPWTAPPTSPTASAAATEAAPRPTASLTPPSPAAPALPGSATPNDSASPVASTSSWTRPSWTDPDPTGPLSTPAPSPATASTPTATANTPSTSASPPTAPPTANGHGGYEVPTVAWPSTSATGGAAAPSSATGGASRSSTPIGSSSTATATADSGGPPASAETSSTASTAPDWSASSAPTSTSPTSRPDSSPDDRREWATAQLYRRADDPTVAELRPRDIDREFGTKDGWRVLRDAQARYADERASGAVEAVGVES